MSERSFDDPEESPEALHCQAILASYAWVYGLACYHGKLTIFFNLCFFFFWNPA